VARSFATVSEEYARRLRSRAKHSSRLAGPTSNRSSVCRLGLGTSSSTTALGDKAQPTDITEANDALFPLRVIVDVCEPRPGLGWSSASEDFIADAGRLVRRRVALVVSGGNAGAGGRRCQLPCGLGRWVSGAGGTAVRGSRCRRRCWRPGRAGRTWGRRRTAGCPRRQRRGTSSRGARRSGRAA
jgi:hypothetical protein